LKGIVLLGERESLPGNHDVKVWRLCVAVEGVLLVKGRDWC